MKKKKKIEENKKDITPRMSVRSYPGVALDLTERKLPIIEVPLKKGENYTEIIFMGDFHVGSEGFSEHQLVAYIEWVKNNPHVRVVLMGDLVEVGDLSGHLPAQKEDFKQQIARLVTLLEPIKKQIVCILEGNHEERYAREVKNAIEFSHYLALELGIAKKVLKPGPQKGQMIVFKIGKYYYPIYAIHGSTSSIYNKGTQLKRMAFTTKLPLIIHGHTHQIYHDHYIYRMPSRISGDFYESVFEQHWLVSGCFVKYLGYAEQKSYPMSKIGAPIVRFFGETEGMMVITDALFFYGIGAEGGTIFGGRTSVPPTPADIRRMNWRKRNMGIPLRPRSLVNRLLKKTLRKKIVNTLSAKINNPKIPSKDAQTLKPSLSSGKMKRDTNTLSPI